MTSFVVSLIKSRGKKLIYICWEILVGLFSASLVSLFIISYTWLTLNYSPENCNRLKLTPFKRVEKKKCLNSFIPPLIHLILAALTMHHIKIISIEGSRYSTKTTIFISLTNKFSIFISNIVIILAFGLKF
ncbi:hypothetical protein HZS_4351 [Henneguya salminicola]|nr:hypothetical protein HZS_4351 [Henneguya salminicola]